MRSLSQKLADHVVETRYDDLPTDVVAATKWFVLDTLGVAWAGTNAPGVEALRRVVFAENGSGKCTVLADEQHLPPTTAALLNGTYAGALDYDGVYEKGSIHPDIVTLPAALAIAEMRRATGREFLTALAIGNDISCRSGGAMRGNRGWFNTAIHGVFGATAAAAKLLDLDAAGVANAIGLSFSQASGSQQAIAEKSLVKRMLSGMTARAGVFGALAAEQGISAPQEVFEGKFGFYTLYGEGDSDALVAGLGRHFENVTTATKKYPSCTANHVAIEAAIALADEHDLTSENVDEIRVVVSPFMNGLVGGPFEPRDNPQVAAQFSVQYSIACGIVRRRLGIAEIQEGAIFDPVIKSLADKVSVGVNEDWTGKFSPCDLVIRMHDGRELRRHAAHTPGTRDNPMSIDELKGKFRDCVSSGTKPMTTAQTELAIESILSIEELDDMAELFDFVK